MNEKRRDEKINKYKKIKRKDTHIQEQKRKDNNIKKHGKLTRTDKKIK